ncbi:MAG TPA: hypothetical protein VGV92_09515 [Gammaproteobacteria bacterium]|nr:hypothetical protein [Gammaproteobacteria bacterium]
MLFVDYYAVLDVPRDATEHEINVAYGDIITTPNLSADLYRLALEARQLLTNIRARENYDKTFGYPIVIQTQSADYPNARCYQLAQSEDVITRLLSIKEDFKHWIVKKTQLDWMEAQRENYDYEIVADADAPYLIMRFMLEREANAFAKKLMDERRIKS